MLELKKLVNRACLVSISPRSSPSENASLPMILIWRTLDLGPSLISKTISTRFCDSCTIFGSTVAAKRPCRLYSSIMRATSARTFERVNICRGESRISGRILSFLIRLLPSRMIRLMTGFSTMVMTTLPSRLTTLAFENSSVA